MLPHRTTTVAKAKARLVSPPSKDTALDAFGCKDTFLF